MFKSGYAIMSNKELYKAIVGGEVKAADSLSIVIKTIDGKYFEIEPASDGYGWTGFNVNEVMKGGE